MKKIINIVIISLFLLLFVSCNENDYKITVEEKELVIEINQSIDINAKILKDNQEVNLDYLLTIEDENSKYLLIEDHKITGIKIGSVILRVSLKDNKDAYTDIKIVITEQKINIKEIIFEDGQEFTLYLQESKLLHPIITPSNYNQSDLIWKSNDESIVKVNNGIVTGLNYGETNIIYTDNISKVTGSILVKVIKKPLKQITISTKDQIYIEDDYSQNLIDLTFIPLDSDTNINDITFISSDETILEVIKENNSFYLKGINPGKADIYLTSPKGYISEKKSIEVIHHIDSIGLASIETNNNEINLEILKNTIKNYDIVINPLFTNNDLLVTCDNNNINIVFNEKEMTLEVTGLKIGKSLITIKDPHSLTVLKINIEIMDNEINNDVIKIYSQKEFSLQEIKKLKETLKVDLQVISLPKEIEEVKKIINSNDFDGDFICLSQNTLLDDLSGFEIVNQNKDLFGLIYNKELFDNVLSPINMYNHQKWNYSDFIKFLDETKTKINGNTNLFLSSLISRICIENETNIIDSEESKKLLSFIETLNKNYLSNDESDKCLKIGYLSEINLLNNNYEFVPFPYIEESTQEINYQNDYLCLSKLSNTLSKYIFDELNGLNKEKYSLINNLFNDDFITFINHNEEYQKLDLSKINEQDYLNEIAFGLYIKYINTKEMLYPNFKLNDYSNLDFNSNKYTFKTSKDELNSFLETMKDKFTIETLNNQYLLSNRNHYIIVTITQRNENDLVLDYQLFSKGDYNDLDEIDVNNINTYLNEDRFTNFLDITSKEFYETYNSRLLISITKLSDIKYINDSDEFNIEYILVKNNSYLVLDGFDNKNYYNIDNNMDSVKDLIYFSTDIYFGAMGLKINIIDMNGENKLNKQEFYFSTSISNLTYDINNDLLLIIKEDSDSKQETYKLVFENQKPLIKEMNTNNITDDFSYIEDYFYLLLDETTIELSINESFKVNIQTNIYNEKKITIYNTDLGITSIKGLSINALRKGNDQITFKYNNTITNLNVKVNSNMAYSINDYRYWTDKATEQDEILMDEEGISNYNAKVYSDYSRTEVYDLSKLSVLVSKSYVLSLINEYTNINKYSVYNPDGSLVRDTSSILNNRNLNNIKEQVTCQYAIITSFASMVSYPTFAYSSSRAISRFQETGINVGECVIVYHYSLDNQWCFVQAENYHGWIETRCIAVCSSEEFNMYYKPENFFVVTSERYQINTDNETVKYRMSDCILIQKVINDQYYVYLPVKDVNGNLVNKVKVINNLDNLHLGYLTYTRNNILTQAFKLLGTPYRWGDYLEDGRDCSSTMNAIFKCFGFVMPRNTSNQSKVPSFSYTVSGLNASSLSKLPVGTMIFSSSHVMLYIGNDLNGNPYILHNTTSGNACKLQLASTYNLSGIIAYTTIK